ncbi:MAG: hypothetical protein L3J79_01000, partial [Candidatus Marinimicrobia bacterium]|nr:hypothetical protein [Candidatus Neomarinimicrobiota bacterium]
MREIRSTTNIKLGLFVLAILIISISLLYTNWLVKELRADNLQFLRYNSNLLANALSADLQSKAYQEEQRQFLSYNAKLYASALTADSPSMDFAFNQIIRNISFPIIITVIEHGEQVIYAYRNIQIPDTVSRSGLSSYLLGVAGEMDGQNESIPVKYLQREIMLIHYGKPVSKQFEEIMGNVIRAINFPMILTSGNDPANYVVQDHTLTLDKNLSSNAQHQLIQSALRRMDAKNPPVPVDFGEETVMLIHYEDSELIQALRWFPCIE